MDRLINEISTYLTKKELSSVDDLNEFKEKKFYIGNDTSVITSVPKVLKTRTQLILIKNLSNNENIDENIDENINENLINLLTKRGFTSVDSIAEFEKNKTGAVFHDYRQLSLNDFRDTIKDTIFVIVNENEPKKNKPYVLTDDEKNDLDNGKMIPINNSNLSEQLKAIEKYATTLGKIVEPVNERIGYESEITGYKLVDPKPEEKSDTRLSWFSKIFQRNTNGGKSRRRKSKKKRKARKNRRKSTRRNKR